MGKAIGLAAGLALLTSPALHAQGGTIINCTSRGEDRASPPLTFQISDGAIYWYNLDTRRFEHICRMWNIEKPRVIDGTPAQCTTSTTAQDYIVRWEHRTQYIDGGPIHTEITTLIIDRYELTAKANSTNYHLFDLVCKIGELPNMAPKI